MMPGSSQVRRGEVTVRDLPLEFFEAGDGPPLLFLHGMAGAARSLDAIAALAESHHVIAPSHPGYGESRRPDHIDSVADLAYLYLDLIDQIAAQEGPVVVVGCSIGGWIAAEVAVRSQASIAGLVLSTPLGIKTGGRLDRDIADIYALTPQAVREALYFDPDFGAVDFSRYSDEELQVHFRNLEATALYGWKPYMHNPKLLGRLPRITVPTLVVTGEADAFLSADLPSAYQGAIPGATSVSVARAGHEPEREQPQSFSTAVSEFLSGIRVLQNS
jgi:pimeloyl-ACP methyl ester carboxylesterase